MQANLTWFLMDENFFLPFLYQSGLEIKNSEYDQEYHNYKLQTNPWHRREEQHYYQEILSSHQDDFKTRMDTK